MSSPYPGQPLFATAITLPDDSAPPQAAEFNVALTALRDDDVYLKAYIEGPLTTLVKQSSARLGVASFMPADCGSAFYGTADDMFVDCIGASESRFAAVLERDSQGVAKIALSADGYGWREIGQITSTPGPTPSAIGILDVFSGTTNDCYVVVGGAYADLTDDPGKWIRVMKPGASGFTSATATALSGNTNYGACVFAGSRCYLFGGTLNLTGTDKVTGYESRIVSASAADDFAVWSNPAGGSFGGGNELKLVDRWDVAAVGNVVVGFPINFVTTSTYVTVDAVTNVVTTQTFPGGSARRGGLCAWRGLFWHACLLQSDLGNVTKVFSSPDGVTWTLQATLPCSAARGLATSGDMLVLVGKYEPTLGARVSTGLTVFCSFDGLAWDRLPVSFRSSNLGDHTICSTDMRTAYLLKRGVKFGQSNTNFRVNLGGMAP